jgi:CheY-like chemotaxis protein
LARKILLADDSVTAQNMGRKILADAGYEVIAVNNGSAALKKIAELKPDLVILDVYMPGYSGLEVCQRLKESPETDRVPVLLSVGKLEPFKPEEAKRVRADGYIVKPFEASELLSALSKLEDKIVPRSEPSKPGRFARAVAVAEEASQGRRSETPTGSNGWESRLGMPHAKTEPEESVQEESAIYNAMNRDLRTVIDKTVAETVTPKPSETELQPAPAATVDVAALSSAGLPTDVTAAELAAITAAAAQIQIAGAAFAEAQSESNFPAASPQSVPESAAQVTAEPETVTDTQKVKEKKVQDARNADSGQREPEPEDIPVTMAAASEATSGASRWTAVAVALEDNEAKISLDHEMQKANATPVAADGAAVFSQPEITPAAPVENSSARADASVQGPIDQPIATPVAAISNPSSDLLPQVTPVSQPNTAPQLEPAPQQESAGQIETASQAEPVASQPSQEIEATPAAQAEAAPIASAPVASAPAPEPANPYQIIGARPQAEAAAAAANSSENRTAQPAAISATSEPAMQGQEPAPNQESAAIASSASESVTALSENQPYSETSAPRAPEQTTQASEYAHSEPQPQLNSETVKSTAAAWASWRQVRDTGKSAESASAQPTEFAIPSASSQDTNARAVAAGAEQILQAVAASDSAHNPSDVASIVDSVLADLRPKLMEEISRKMAEKK